MPWISCHSMSLQVGEWNQTRSALSVYSCKAVFSIGHVFAVSMNTFMI